MQLEVKRVLTSYQAQFIAEFLAPGSPKHHWLSAPSGSGLSQCAIGIIAGVKSAKPEARILLLSPRPLVLQWFRRLDSTMDSSLLVEGNRRNLRELSDAAGRSSFTWPAGHVIVMDSWFGERSPELERSVFDTPWDLVIWEGLHLSGIRSSAQRLRLLERMGEASTIDRILVLSHNLRSHQDLPGFPWLKRTVWDRASLDDREMATRQFEWQESPLLFMRSDSEKELLHAVQTFVEHWRSDSSGFSPMDRLLSAAESSPLALQEYLQRLRPSKAAMVLQQATDLEDDDSHDEQEDTSKGGASGESSGPGRQATEAAELLDLIDSLPVDGKLDALQRFLAEEERGDRHVVVDCRFSATARYLRAALSDFSFEVRLATADMGSREIVRLLSEFENSGGVLIVTTAALQGVELQADSIVVYDQVGEWMRSGLRPRVRPRAPELPLEILYLKDESRAAEFAPEL